MIQDLWYGARLLARTRGFSATLILMLALGLGATTAIFSVVDAVLLKQLPFHDPERLLVIWEKNPTLNRLRMFAAPANYQEWRQCRSLESVAALLPGRVNLTAGPKGQLNPEELKAERVSAALFPLLGIQPVTGRTFQQGEDQPGVSLAMMSYSLWQRRFGGDASIVGQSLWMSNRSYTVIGVLPPGFSVLDPQVDMWLPLGLNLNDARQSSARNLVVISRLRKGVEISQARAELETLGDRLAQANPGLNQGWRPSVFPLMEELVGKVQKPLLVLLAAVGLLLLLACANVANLLLARGAARRKEIAVRMAVGASRARVIAQLLSESVLLAVVGGAAGLLVARGALALLAWLGTGSIPRLAGAQIDFRLLLFALAVSVATGVLFGIAPALQLSERNVQRALQETSRGGTPGRKARAIRNTLVAVQIAIAIVVMIGSGLLARSFIRLRAIDPGFRPEGLLTFRLPLAGGRNSAADRRPAFLTEAAERIATLPGVSGVGIVDSLPLRGLAGGALFSIVGRPPLPPDRRPVGLVRFASGTYFRTMGIPLLAGREFTALDTPEKPSVVIVNRTLARRFWPDGSPIGDRIALVAANERVAEIVGVVGDVKSERLDGDEWPVLYYAYTQATPSSMTFVVRTSGRPTDLASAAAREIHKLDPDQAMPDTFTMEEVVNRAIAGSRFNTVVLGVFAIIAFVLAAVGIYGVISYDVSRRTGEIGIRMAFGAQKGDVLKLVLGQGAKLAACGIAGGLAAAFGLTRLMATMLFDVAPSDPRTFAAVSLLLGAVALAAGYLPARRAMALHPVHALRHE